MISAMIDIETLDTKPNSVILSVGGVKFNAKQDKEPWDEFYFRLNVEDQENRAISEDTIKWWSQQDPEIQENAFSDKDRIHVSDFLKKLNKWLVDVDEIWAHGYGFDLIILESLYRDNNQPFPWHFGQCRDSRTLFKLFDIDPRKNIQQNLHNPLEDAYYQAKAVIQSYKNLRIIDENT